MTRNFQTHPSTLVRRIWSRISLALGIGIVCISLNACSPPSPKQISPSQAAHLPVQQDKIYTMVMDFVQGVLKDPNSPQITEAENRIRSKQDVDSIDMLRITMLLRPDDPATFSVGRLLILAAAETSLSNKNWAIEWLSATKANRPKENEVWNTLLIEVHSLKKKTID